MGFTVEQECPQCGAPIVLDETDRLLRCAYCNVKSLIFSPSYFRYRLPHRVSGEDIIYLPYLRFRGTIYFCKDLTIGYRIVDLTHTGLDIKGIPATLGIRPQAMKMRFLTSETTGLFLRSRLDATDILTRAGKISSGTPKGRIFHRAFIGDTTSLIYLPMYIKGDALVDAVINRPVTGLTLGRESIETEALKNPKWEIAFIPALCPACGWNLEGERDSVVHLCQNCGTAWAARDGRLKPVQFEIMYGRYERNIYLPFWKFTVISRDVGIKSFADFIRLTNQPLAIDENWEKEDMSFWSPAFKIRPKLFLNISRNLTIVRKELKTENKIPREPIFPVTLQLREALQALKIILAASCVDKRDLFPNLPRIRFEVKESILSYLPFAETTHDMIQWDTGISINKRSLFYGRGL